MHSGEGIFLSNRAFFCRTGLFSVEPCILLSNRAFFLSDKCYNDPDPSMETTWCHNNNTSVQHYITDNRWQNGFLSLHSRLCVYNWVLIYNHQWLLAVSHIVDFEMSLLCYYNQHSINFTRPIQPAWVCLKSPFYNMANKAYQHYCL